MSDRDKLRTIAQQLKGKEGHYWRTFARVEALMGWLHCRGKCVYCTEHVELVDPKQMIDGLATTDHLLPKKKYPELDFTDKKLAFRDYLNAVPCCSGCNGLKRSWDPNTEAPNADVLYRRGDDVRLTEDMQAEFIRRAKLYIESERKRRRITNVKDRENWFATLKEIDGG